MKFIRNFINEMILGILGIYITIGNPLAIKKSSERYGQNKKPIVRILYSRPKDDTKKINKSAFIAHYLQEILKETKTYRDWEVKIDTTDVIEDFERKIFEEIEDSSCHIFLVLEQFSLGEVTTCENYNSDSCSKKCDPWLDEIHSHFYKELVFCIDIKSRDKEKKIIPIYIGEVNTIQDGLLKSISYYKVQVLNILGSSSEYCVIKPEELLGELFRLNSVTINPPNLNQIFTKDSRATYIETIKSALKVRQVI